jgi:hypothetical protein
MPADAPRQSPNTTNPETQPGYFLFSWLPDKFRPSYKEPEPMKRILLSAIMPLAIA